METLSHACYVGCPWELLYADDLVIMSNNLEDLEIYLQAWRTALGTRGLKINKCSGVKRTLKKGSVFRCKKWKGESLPTSSWNFTQVHVVEETFEAVPTLQYLGDMSAYSLCR